MGQSGHADSPLRFEGIPTYLFSPSPLPPSPPRLAYINGASLAHVTDSDGDHVLSNLFRILLLRGACFHVNLSPYI